MTRIGTVFVFREGVTKEEAAKALESIRNVIDLGYYISDRGANMSELINEYDDEYGGPVWYIP